MSKKHFRIAVYPGDGIGKDVTAEALRVLERVQQMDGSFALDCEQFNWGCDYFDQYGQAAPDNLLDILRPFDAILLGAVGFPARLPDHVSLEPLVRIRQHFDQYACVRPAKLFKGVRSLLATDVPIDMVVVRENSEGEYVASGGRFHPGHPEEVAVENAIHSRRGIERVLRFGFELARTRRRKLTMITKSNAMRYGMVLWDQVLEEVRGDYGDVQADRQHVDAAAMNFVRRPGSFDVVVASNLFGDILTDLSGAIVGSLGLNPSANLNPSRQFPSLFEPVHGSAPDIVDQGIANPVGAILCAAMMLDWLGLSDPARGMMGAVEAALAAGIHTPDLGGKATTSQLTDAVIQRL